MSWTNNFLNVSPKNEALLFLNKRIRDEGYRGVHISQHNRFGLKGVITVLETLNEKVPYNSKMNIRTTDLKKRPQIKNDEIVYAEFCEKVKERLGRGSQDSIRKNFFVDFHRMGLIRRYNKNGEEVDPYEGGVKKFVSLSKLGIKLINASEIDKYYLYSKCLDNLFEGRINTIIEIMRNSDYDLKYISIEEYQFFISAIKTDTNFSIDVCEAVRLIKKYRNLAITQRNAINDILKKDLKPNKKYPKNEQRDYGNWLNEAEQTFDLLKQTIYFDVVDKKLRLITSSKLDPDIPKLLRSSGQKQQYFEEHKVSKQSGFELHHVVPLVYSESKYDFKRLDRWENMVYIDGFNHAKITQNQNRNIIMKSDCDNLILVDYSDNQVYLKNVENVLYNIKHKNLMLEYNLNLRENRQI